MSSLSPETASDLFRKPPDRYLDVGDAAVAYRRVGQGTDVVFSHGWPASGATFRRMLPYLADHVTCHVVDLPGAGDSRFDRSTSISILDHAESLRRAVDELGLTRFGVVGHDSGGMIARFAFADDPRVQGWGLIATEQPPKAHWRFSSFLAVRVVPRFEEMLARVVTRPRLRKNKFILGDAFADKGLLDGEFEEFFLGGDEGGLGDWGLDSAEGDAAADHSLKEQFFDSLYWEGATFAFRQNQLPAAFFAPAEGDHRIALETDAFLLEAMRSMVQPMLCR